MRPRESVGRRIAQWKMSARLSSRWRCAEDLGAAEHALDEVSPRIGVGGRRRAGVCAGNWPERLALFEALRPVAQSLCVRGVIGQQLVSGQQMASSAWAPAGRGHCRCWCEGHCTGRRALGFDVVASTEPVNTPVEPVRRRKFASPRPDGYSDFRSWCREKDRREVRPATAKAQHMHDARDHPRWSSTRRAPNAGHREGRLDRLSAHSSANSLVRKPPLRVNQTPTAQA